MTMPVQRSRPAHPPIRQTKARAGLVEDIRAFAGFSAEERSVLIRTGELLRSIEFGTVVIVVQDGHVIQIEAGEKFRL